MKNNKIIVKIKKVIAYATLISFFIILFLPLLDYIICPAELKGYDYVFFCSEKVMPIFIIIILICLVGLSGIMLLFGIAFLLINLIIGVFCKKIVLREFLHLNKQKIILTIPSLIISIIYSLFILNCQPCPENAECEPCSPTLFRLIFSAIMIVILIGINYFLVCFVIDRNNQNNL